MPEPLLPSFAPLGVGTADAESLSSFAQRVAAAQGVLPGQLLSRVLGWLDRGRPEMVGAWCRRTPRVRMGHNNGYGHAVVWLRLLQRLTGRADLEQLTTLAWDHNFPTRGFLRRHLAWCPFCLMEDDEPYHRLLWMLQSVVGCLHHLVALCDRCPQCRRQIPVVHDRSMILMCPYCTGDLRKAVTDGGGLSPSEFTLWSAREVGEIIAASANWHRPIKWSPARSLKRLSRGAGFDNAAAFAHFLGTSKITVWYWFTGTARPSLPMALSAYHRAGSSLAAALSGRPDRPEPLAERQPEFHLRERRIPRKRDWAVMKQLLMAALEQPLEKSEALAEFSRRHGVAARALREHYPGLCRELARRNARRKRADARKRDRELKDQIRGAIRTLRRAGIGVTQSNIAMTLKRPGLFSRHNARTIFLRLTESSALTRVRQFGPG